MEKRNDDRVKQQMKEQAIKENLNAVLKLLDDIIQKQGHAPSYNGKYYDTFQNLFKYFLSSANIKNISDYDFERLVMRISDLPVALIICNLIEKKAYSKLAIFLSCYGDIETVDGALCVICQNCKDTIEILEFIRMFTNRIMKSSQEEKFKPEYFTNKSVYPKSSKLLIKKLSNIRDKSFGKSLERIFKELYGPKLEETSAKITPDSFAHNFLQICASHGHELFYAHFLSNYYFLWQNLSDKELLKAITKILINKAKYGGNPELSYEERIYYGLYDVYVLYEITLEQCLSNPSEKKNLDLRALKHALFKRTTDVFEPLDDDFTKMKELLNKLLSNHELGQFLVCAFGGRQIKKTSVSINLANGLNATLENFPEPKDIIITLYSPLIDDIDNITLEDAKRVDDAYDLYCKEKEAISPIISSLDIKQKKIKPLNQSSDAIKLD